MGASVVVAAVSVGLLVFALISRSQAVSEQVSARAQALSAESQAELPDDPEISLILGMRAVREKPTPQSLFALRAALDASPLERAFPTLAAGTSCGLNSGLTAALNPQGTQIAEGTCGGKLVLLDEASGRVVHSLHLAQPVVALTYSPSGSLLAVGTTNKILLVDARRGTVVQARNALTTGHIVVSGVNPGIVALAFSPDGHELAANDMNGVKLWSVPGMKGRQLASDPGVGDSMLFTPNARELLVGGASDGSVNVYALPGGHLVRRLSSGGVTNGWPVVLALSRDGSELAVGYPSPINSNGIVSLFSARTWKKQFDLASIANVAIASVSLQSGRDPPGDRCRGRNRGRLVAEHPRGTGVLCGPDGGGHLDGLRPRRRVGADRVQRRRRCACGGRRVTSRRSCRWLRTSTMSPSRRGCSPSLPTRAGRSGSTGSDCRAGSPSGGGASGPARRSQGSSLTTAASG